MDPRERSLLDAVIAAPDDDAPRLVYADWLAEQGDPHGEFIALQVAAAATEPDPAAAQRAEALRAEHDERWTAALGPYVESVHYRRGLAHSAHVHLSERSDPLAFMDMAPIRYLSVSLLDIDVDPDEPEGASQCQSLARNLARDPRTARLHGLDLSSAMWGDGAIADLFASDYLGEMRRLAFNDGDSHPYTARAIATCPSLARLETLCFYGDYDGDLGDEGARMLAECPRLTSMRSLLLYNLAIGAAGARAIAASPHFSGLTTLDFGWGSYSCNRIGANGAAAIAASESLGHLERLTLDYNDIGDRGFTALARSRTMNRLTNLSSKSNGIGDPSLFALAQSKGLPGLRHLELTFNRDITSAGVTALASSKRFHRLESLWLRQCPQIGPYGAMAIARSPHATGLRDLNLLECQIGPDGARAIAESQHLSGLTTLQLSGNRLDDDTRALLKDRFGDRVDADR